MSVSAGCGKEMENSNLTATKGRSERSDKSQNYVTGIKRRGNAIVAIVVGVLALIFFAFAIIYYIFTFLPSAVKAIGETVLGSSAQGQNASLAALRPVDCSGTSVPKIYLPVIKQAAKRFLGGDEAMIISLISIESNFRPQAMSGTGAVGIAQFTAPTARGTQEAGLFKGMTIITVPRADKSSKRLVTAAEQQSFLLTYPNSGRLYPNPSIEAAAYKISFAVKKYGSLREGYAQGYHTIGKNGEHQTAAYAGADRLMAIYNRIRAGGGCRELKDTPGKLGEEIRKLIIPQGSYHPERAP